MGRTRLRAGRYDRSYRSLPVYWPTRWRLLWAARSDRRAGLPLGLSPTTTPLLRALVARHDDVCERERNRYFSEIELVVVRLATIEVELPAVERALPDLIQAALRAAKPRTDDELSVRRAGELDLPDEIIRQRREREHRRAAEKAESARAEAQRRLDDLRAEQSRLLAKCQHRADVARSRALRYGDYTQRLGDIYRRALSRRHPQRGALVSTWQSTFCPPPAWVTADDIIPSFRAVGVEA